MSRLYVGYCIKSHSCLYNTLPVIALTFGRTLSWWNRITLFMILILCFERLELQILISVLLYFSSLIICPIFMYYLNKILLPSHQIQRSTFLLVKECLDNEPPEFSHADHPPKLLVLLQYTIFFLQVLIAFFFRLSSAVNSQSNQRLK